MRQPSRNKNKKNQKKATTITAAATYFGEGRLIARSICIMHECSCIVEIQPQTNQTILVFFLLFLRFIYFSFIFFDVGFVFVEAQTRQKFVSPTFIFDIFLYIFFYHSNNSLLNHLLP